VFRAITSCLITRSSVKLFECCLVTDRFLKDLRPVAEVVSSVFLELMLHVVLTSVCYTLVVLPFSIIY